MGSPGCVPFYDIGRTKSTCDVVRRRRAAADEVITAMKLTSATPTRSAADVDAVRRGLRMAFCRARNAGSPSVRTSGHPRVLASGPRDEGTERCKAHECEHRSSADEVALVADAGE